MTAPLNVNSELWTLDNFVPVWTILHSRFSGRFFNPLIIVSPFAPAYGTVIVQTSTKLSNHFNIKDKVYEKHQSNQVYYREWKNKKCDEDYIRETGRRKVVRTSDHGGKDKQSWIFKHSSSTKPPRAKDSDFKLLARNYENIWKRRLAEAMYIRDLKPSLNKRKESYKLALFAWYLHWRHIFHKIEKLRKTRMQKEGNWWS